MKSNVNVPCGGDIDEVLLGDPGVPVVLQRCLSSSVVLVLTERPLVDNSGVARFFEEGWSNPWLATRDQKLIR